jgi:hypothetical protein
MNYAQQYYLAQIAALTNALLSAGYPPDSAAQKARDIFAEVRTLAAIEAEQNPIPDPAEEMLRKQADLQARLQTESAKQSGPVDPDKAIDYDSMA